MHVTEADKNEITLLLQSDRDGKAISEKLFPLIYGELRRMAAAQMAGEKPGQTLQPTALVHEAYLRLVGDSEVHWQNRAHFFSAAIHASDFGQSGDKEKGTKTWW